MKFSKTLKDIGIVVEVHNLNTGEISYIGEDGLEHSRPFIFLPRGVVPDRTFAESVVNEITNFCTLNSARLHELEIHSLALGVLSKQKRKKSIWSMDL